MRISMNEPHIVTMEQVRSFLRGAEAVEMAISSKSECCDWIWAFWFVLSTCFSGRPLNGFSCDICNGPVVGLTIIEYERLCFNKAAEAAQPYVPG
jgi:hypothetical protein